MIKLLIGGSPCTKWSVAQTKDRETQPNSGIGWELFENYKIALDKYNPDYFLYENNKSAAQPIKDQISRELGVDLVYINSALVSAQNRQRFYAFNWTVDQPEDRGILLRDILESGVTDRDKARCVTASVGRTTHREYFMKRHTMSAEPVAINTTADGKAQCLRATCYKDGIRNMVGNNVDLRTCVAEPVPCGQRQKDKSRTITAGYQTCSQCDLRMDIETDGFMGKQGVIESIPYYATPIEWDENGRPTKAISAADGKPYRVYEVKDGKITIKGKEYPIKLPDGFYIIRKLTVKECARLQTIPDWYEFPVSDSQAYKMIGNGWTIEVIKYLLSHIPNIQNEEIEVLSMYDGMSCGQIALKELGCNVVRYYATEIDKYAIQTTQHNFPNTIQLGDAFQVRDSEWHL